MTHDGCHAPGRGQLAAAVQDGAGRLSAAARRARAAGPVPWVPPNAALCPFSAKFLSPGVPAPRSLPWGVPSSCAVLGRAMVSGEKPFCRPGSRGAEHGGAGASVVAQSRRQVVPLCRLPELQPRSRRWRCRPCHGSSGSRAGAGSCLGCGLWLSAALESCRVSHGSGFDQQCLGSTSASSHYRPPPAALGREPRLGVCSLPCPPGQSRLRCSCPLPSGRPVTQQPGRRLEVPRAEPSPRGQGWLCLNLLRSEALPCPVPRPCSGAPAAAPGEAGAGWASLAPGRACSRAGPGQRWGDWL